MKFIDRLKFLRKRPSDDLSLSDVFPRLVRNPKPVTLHEPVSGIIGLTTLIATVMAEFTSAGVITVGIATTASWLGGTLISIGLMAGLSLLTSSLSTQKKSTSLNADGKLINGGPRYELYTCNPFA